MTWKLEVITKTAANVTITEMSADDAKKLVLDAMNYGITIFSKEDGFGHFIHKDNILQVLVCDESVRKGQSLFKTDGK